MDRLHIDSPAASTWALGARWTSRLQYLAVAMALLMPGSFAVLPLIWLWHRRKGSRTQ